MTTDKPRWLLPAYFTSIPALACPCPPELELPSTNSYGYWSQSSPAFSRTCPAPLSGILVKYAG